MGIRKNVLVFGLFWVWACCIAGRLPAQDFVLLGCYWDCPDDAAAEIDPASLNFWVDKMKGQAPVLRHAGFSYIWLPGFFPEQQRQIADLVGSLRKNGMEAMLDLDLTGSTQVGDSMSYPLEQAGRLRRDLQVRGLRLTADSPIQPGAISRLLGDLQRKQEMPLLLVVRTQEKQSPGRLAGFVGEVERNLPASPEEPPVEPRVFDYPLREALRRACSNPAYDVRQVFNSSIRDVTALSGFNVVTLVNSPEFYNPNGIKGDADDLIEEPLLAYAYTLTNNQIGLPAVFYGDYFGPDSEIEFFLNKAPLQKEIDQLIKAHREYIFNATSVEYLNRIGTDRAAKYLSGTPQQTLLFQLDGANTPAGRSANGQGRDVLVAINFADTTLRVYHEINPSNCAPGDRFTDILERSGQAATTVADQPDFQISNAVYLEVPPRSYSIWVQGPAEAVAAGAIDFSAQWQEQYVELNWEVPEEGTIKGYEIQRSLRGEPYQPIAWIDAIGASGESASYLYVDENVFPGESIQYRVKAVGAHNKEDLSTVRRVRIPTEEWQFEVLGEHSAIKTVRIRSNFADQVNIALFNAEGDCVWKKTEALQRGINLSRLDMTSFPRGVYFLHVTNSRNKRWTQRVVRM